MVGKLLGESSELPASETVLLGESALQFTANNAQIGNELIKGALLSIELFLSPRFPSPLKLFTQIEVLQRHETTSTVLGQLIGIDDKVLDLIGKFIFREHRRAIAHAKHKSE